MNKEEILQFRKSLRLTQEQFAHILGTTTRTIYNWEAGVTKPSRMAIKLLAEVKAGIHTEQSRSINKEKATK